jgi:hypothetical protein
MRSGLAEICCTDGTQGKDAREDVLILLHFGLRRAEFSSCQPQPEPGFPLLHEGENRIE